VDAKHHQLVNKLNEKMNSRMKSQVERQPTKKKQNVSSSEISNFFFQNFLTKNQMQQK
jgi:hypothetical protein